jgi:hypothetical protein
VAKKFPDLTGDGKVTRADVLKGRGVYKSGGSVPKGMHRMPDGSLMKDSEHKEQMMKKPVKKFAGGMMKAILPAVKKAVGASGMPREANPGVISQGKGPLGKIVTAMATANPQQGQPATPSRGLLGRVAQMAAEAAKNAPVAAPRPQGRGVLGRVAQAAAAAAARRAKPTGMKKGGAVIKKAVKKTTRKK